MSWLPAIRAPFLLYKLRRSKGLFCGKKPPAVAKPKILIRRRKKPEPPAAVVEPQVEPTSEEQQASEQPPPAAQPVPPPPVVMQQEEKQEAEPKLVVEQETPTSSSPEAKSASKPVEKPPPTNLKEIKAREKAAYGKVKNTAKSRRSATVNTRDILRAVESDGEPPADEFKPTKVRTVYVPIGSASKRDIKRKKNLQKTQITTSRASHRLLKMQDGIEVLALAKRMSVKVKEVLAKLVVAGIEAEAQTIIDIDTAALIAAEFNYEVRNQAKTLQDIIALQQQGRTENLRERPPVVTVMGHVDHGKTSILDAIRATDVAAGEAGGITQHIGAYTVSNKKRAITFLDTPGHEAFTAMRVRGAQLTDVVILVVAADDGVMPQTIESISHAQDAGVPIIVALNKIDRPNKNLDRIFSELSERGVQVERWGGEVQCVEVSAKEKTGIDALLESVLLQAEVMELQANANAAPNGIVIEAYLDPHRGAVATLLVQEGTLRGGDYIVTKLGYAKVRTMSDYRGQVLKSALLSTPVLVSGFSQVPNVGDRFDATPKERDAKEVFAWYERQKERVKSEVTAAKSLDELLQIAALNESPELSLIVKADAQGSIEAVVGALLNIKSDKVRNKILYSGVGAVNESDIVRASATGSMIVAFNVRAHKDVAEHATKLSVVVQYYTIIYEIIDAVRALMVGLLPPDINEVIVGHAEVRNPISVPRVGIIAGSSVKEGKITRRFPPAFVARRSGDLQWQSKLPEKI